MKRIQQVYADAGIIVRTKASSSQSVSLTTSISQLVDAGQ